MDAVFASWRDMDVTENHIRQLHRDLLRHSGKDQRHRGAWTTAPNSIAAFDETGRQIGVVFETATPFDTPGRMVELIDWYNAATQDHDLHPLLLIGIFVVVFLEIHPFQDGNGRLSRVLTTLLLFTLAIAVASRLRRREQEATALYQAARVITSSLEVNEVLSRLLAMCTQTLKASAGIVRLLSSDGVTLEFSLLNSRFSIRTSNASIPSSRRYITCSRTSAIRLFISEFGIE